MIIMKLLIMIITIIMIIVIIMMLKIASHKASIGKRRTFPNSSPSPQGRFGNVLLVEVAF